MEKQGDDLSTPVAELRDPEKTRDASTSSFDVGDKDEALRLVGLERTELFTEEQCLRVRRKLVSTKSDWWMPFVNSYPSS